MKTENKPKPYCHFEEQQIQESGLLSDERFAEIQAGVSARIEPVFDRSGKELLDACIVDQGESGRWLHPAVNSDHSRRYVRRSALIAVLTSEELETINKHCLSAASERKDAADFEKANKVTSWDEGAWLGDTYYHTMDDLICALTDDEEEWPEYVWGSRPITVIGSLSVDDVVENQISDSGWEDMETGDLEGVEELQKALDAFTEANAGVVSYLPTHKTAILLSEYKKAYFSATPPTEGPEA